MEICDKCGAQLAYMIGNNGVTYKKCSNCGKKFCYPEPGDAIAESND